MIIRIDTQGMNENEKTVAVITEILKVANIKGRKEKAKEIRERNRLEDIQRKKRGKYERANKVQKQKSDI